MQHKTRLQEDYEGLIPTIEMLSLAAQFISGSTAAVGIFVVILGKLPIAIKILAILLSTLLTIIIIGSFEGGIRKIFPFWIRQILNWFFEENKEDKKPSSIRVILFSMVSILLLPLVLGTTLSSWKASPDLVDYAVTAPITKDLEAVSIHLDSASNLMIQQFNQDITRDSIVFVERIKAEKSKWNAKIEAQNIQRKKYLSLHQQGVNWAKGSAAKIKNSIIPELKIKMQESLQAIQLERAKVLEDIHQQKSTTLLNENRNKLNILSDTRTHNDYIVASNRSNREKWGDFLAVLAIILTFFTLFCFVFIEAYYAGIVPVSFAPNTRPENRLHNAQNLPPDTPTGMKSLVPQGSLPNLTQDSEDTQLHTELSLVVIDKLIKRTRMQWKRSQDSSKSLEKRAVNRKKAEENMLFLNSIGVEGWSWMKRMGVGWWFGNGRLVRIDSYWKRVVCSMDYL